MSEPSEDNKGQSEIVEDGGISAESENAKIDDSSILTSAAVPDTVPEVASSPASPPDSASTATSVPASVPASTSKSASVSTPVPAKRGNLFGLALIAIGGVVVVVSITCDIFDKKLPDFLHPFEPAFEQHIRYGIGYSTGAKDWRNELLVEQAIWTNEVNKIRLAQSNAKPDFNKRDYLFYLADSYYRDEPHYKEAKAAYLAGKAEPYIPHEHGYNIPPSELALKIGNSAMRSGSYDEAAKYLKETLALCDSDKEPSRLMMNGGRANLCLDILTECEIRRNHLVEAQNIINERLKRIKIPNIEFTIEPYLLFNNALLLEKQGKSAEAEQFYKKTIEQYEQEDKNRGAVPSGAKDNNRMLAYVLREYARFLRSQNRPSESYDLMDRAVSIMNSSPN
ncbi:hypothetical protein BH11CYA1_BH11CYA1_28430 [soil metagenome]